MGTFLVGAGYTAAPIRGISLLVKPRPMRRATTTYRPAAHGTYRPFSGTPHGKYDYLDQPHKCKCGECEDARLTYLDTRSRSEVSWLGPREASTWCRVPKYIRNPVPSERWNPHAKLPSLSQRAVEDYGWDESDGATRIFRQDWQARVAAGKSVCCADHDRTLRGTSKGFGNYLRCAGIIGQNPQKRHEAGKTVITVEPADGRWRWAVWRSYAGLRAMRGNGRGIAAQIATEHGIPDQRVSEAVSTFENELERAYGADEDSIRVYLLAIASMGPRPHQREPMPGEASNWLQWDTEDGERL